MAATPELPKEYTELLDKFSHIGETYVAEVTGMTPEKREMTEAFVTMMKDLRYPVGKDGSVMNADFFAPFVAYHLVRCGWRPHSEKRAIKPRRVPGKGMVESAVEWVPMDAPDDPLKTLGTMTMQELNALPDVWRHEAIRRLGGEVKSDLPKPVNAWHVDTKINISNMPRDPNEIFK